MILRLLRFYDAITMKIFAMEKMNDYNNNAYKHYIFRIHV